MGAVTMLVTVAPPRSRYSTGAPGQAHPTVCGVGPGKNIGDFRRKPGLAAFLPAMLQGSAYEPVVSLVAWKGSGDMASLIRSNCYLSVPENVEEIRAGEWVSVLPR